MTDYRIIAHLSNHYSDLGEYRSSGLIVVWVVEARGEMQALCLFKDYIMDHQLTDFDIASIDVKPVTQKLMLQITFDKLMTKEDNKNA